MAELNKTDLKAIFKAGAVPTEAQFASLIDSQINTVDTGSTAPTGSSGLVESSVLSPAQGFFNLRSSQPFLGLTTTSPTTGSGMSMHAGLINNIGQPYPNNPFIKTNGGFDIFMDNANQGPLGGDTQTEPLFRVYRGTALAGIPPGVELLELSQQGGLKLSGSITASGTISASGNLIVGGTSALNGDITIPNPVKLYLGGTSGMHVYSEGTSTDENQIILAKTNNLRILNQAHGKDIIFGTENASGTAKTPLTLNGDGNAVFGGSITSADDLSLTSDSSIFNMGAGNDFTITHDGTTGATIRATPLTLTSVGTATLNATGDIILDASQDIVLDAAGGNIEFKDSGTTQLTLDMDGTAGAQVIQLRVDGDDLVFKQFDGTTVFTIGNDSIAYVEEDLKVGDDIWLSSNGGKISFGSSFDNVSLTHVVDTGLLLGGTKKLQFNDASQFIHAPSATVLDIGATDEIELTATLIDVVGNLDVSGDIDLAGNIDVDGTTNLDAVDIDGNVQLDGTFTVGVNDTGYDVKLFGATSGQYLLWDQSADELVLNGDSKLSFHDAAGGENIVASADGHLEINAGTTLDITAPTVDINASTEVTIDTDTLSVLSANSLDPHVIIKNTTNNNKGSRLSFVKDKGVAGADGDIIGIIGFVGDNDAQEQTTFGLIRALVNDASDGAEEGVIAIQVASHDGELNDGIVVISGDVEDEVDITLGNGAASVITIPGHIDLAGDIDVDGTANLDNTDIDGTLVVDGSNISLDSTATLNIDNTNTTNGITINTATSGAPISIGHTTSETTVNDNLSVTGDLAVDGTANLDNTDIDGTLVVDGSNISLDSTTTLNIDNSNTSNGITIGTATSGVPISVGHTTSETTVNDNLTVTGTTTFTGAQVGQKLTIKNITDNVDLTAAESGKLCVFSDADGALVRLPDSGDGSLVGVYYDFYVGIAATSNTHAISCLDGTNEDFEGYLHVIDGDNAAAQATVANRALNSDGFDTIAMNGTTTGTVGTNFRITNIAADRWYVTGHLIATGTPSTPFVAS